MIIFWGNCENNVISKKKSKFDGANSGRKKMCQSYSYIMNLLYAHCFLITTRFILHLHFLPTLLILHVFTKESIFVHDVHPRNCFWNNFSGHLYASVALGLSRCVGHRPLRLCWSFTLASSFFGFRDCGGCGGRGLSNSASRRPTHRNADRGEYYAAQLDQKPKTCQKLDWKTREIDRSCFCLQRFDKLWKWSVCNEQE